jgi:nitrite reductase/ring-hydroxylating ferredoxin subunit
VKREDFFKEMKFGFFKTLKNVYEPFIEDDIEKLEKTTDQVFRIKWTSVCSKDYYLEKFNQFYINGKPIFIIGEEGNMKAYSGICPSCSTLLNFSVLYSTCKCMNCGKDYNFQNKNGELILLELPLALKKDGYFVGQKG